MSAPLLLDNEILRDCLRLREVNGLVPARGLLVSGVVKSTVLADVASSASSTTTTAAPAIASELVRQLHWELSSSTTLRPLAGLMGKAALLPDPWCAQGGVRVHSQAYLPVLRQHPETGLYTILRLDVLLAGSLRVAATGDPLTGDSLTGDSGHVWELIPGDVLLLDADMPVQDRLSPDACVWTAYYYSPDPCCCKAGPDAVMKASA